MSEDQRLGEAKSRSLHDQIQWLFETVKPIVPGVRYCDTRPHHNKELARHLGVSESYVSQLKKGKKPNPTKDVLAGIASFFGVPAAYFFSDAEEASLIEAEIQHGIDLRRFKDGELAEPPFSSYEIPDSSSTVSERLNWLFQHVHNPQDQRPYTDEEVAEAIGEKAWRVRGLRQGEITDSDVSVPVLRNLAAFFGQRLSYLYADEQDVSAPNSDDDQLLELVRQAKTDERGLLGVALRTLESEGAHGGLRSGLSNAASARALAGLIKNHLAMDEELRKNSASGSRPDQAGR
ncbi:helix-turn-helix domain-containing protein [Lentzea jiangxiensis]|uniref:Helix-turn-helix n=1 Tax=Lentzea jiangxiensis TaxID=641025 RepID=A0A1H0WTC5_9PSEU|nr:helix-turn-helix domain-containing protein [Lentzea jiangxiensis]SDP93963.1 Helix-turn-helix [Lentzea jiangxiensis]